MPFLKFNVQVNAHRRELTKHGTALFPAACYYDRLDQEEVPWHWHNEWEIICVEHGSANVSVEGQNYTLQAGEGMFINASSLHMLRALQPPANCRILVCHPRLVGSREDSIFWQSYVQPLLSNQGLKCVHLTGGESWHTEALRYARDAWNACVEEADGYELRTREALSQLAFLLVRHCTMGQKPPTEKALRNEGRIRQMLTYIQTHVQEELTIDSIAGSAAISESECLRCFRAMLGTTPIQYVRQFRLQLASDLLERTELKISEIATQCGFQEMSYFSKIFREAKGCSPREYRRAKRNA